jgi:hypothetical protein
MVRKLNQWLVCTLFSSQEYLEWCGSKAHFRRRVPVAALSAGFLFFNVGQPTRAADSGTTEDVTEAAPATPPHKSEYSLFNPTPDADMRPFDPERPTKFTLPFTIDAGHFQYESDFFNHTHTNYGGAGTQSFEAFDPIIKLGITNWMDFEAALGGYQYTTAHSNLDGTFITNGHGWGDTFLKIKFNLIGNDGGTVALGIVPYFKVPATTLGISNGQVEGGVIVPLQINLPEDFTLNLTSEYDILKNANDDQRHSNFINIVALSHALPFINKDLSGTVEFYSAVGTDAFIKPIYTFDVGVGYLIFANMQLDVGANFGLTRASPGLNVYAGFSVRF